MNASNLKTILEKHKAWIKSNGSEGEGAYLSEANLSEANLSGANLRGADLSGANIDYQIQPNLLKEIAETVIKTPESLQMNAWHSECGTAHCVAGWACALNPVAAKLEKELGTEIAGLLTLGPDVADHFYSDNDEALEYLKTAIEVSA